MILICPGDKYNVIQRIFKIEIRCWTQSNSFLDQYIKIHYITAEDSSSSKWLFNAFFGLHPYPWTQNLAIHNQTLLKEDFN